MSRHAPSSFGGPLAMLRGVRSALVGSVRGRASESRRLVWIDEIVRAGAGFSSLASLAFETGTRRALRRAQTRGELGATSLDFLPPPRAEADRLLDALYRLRQGADRAGEGAELSRFDQRKYTTAFGEKMPASAIAHATLKERFDLHASDFAPHIDRDARAGELSALLNGVSGIEAERSARRLAMLGGPECRSHLTRLRESAGRRGDHALLAALGVHGHPDALDDFLAAMRARDVDPGRGFTQRRIAADGMGELGLRAGVSALSTALTAERTQFEGRPGAGLGIQYPVRANILRALGEIADVSAVPVLLPYLDDVSGSAFGGFYLPAMDALVKIGLPAVPAIRRWGVAASPLGRTNAAGVLSALESPEFR